MQKEPHNVPNELRNLRKVRKVIALIYFILFCLIIGNILLWTGHSSFHGILAICAYPIGLLVGIKWELWGGSIILASLILGITLMVSNGSIDDSFTFLFFFVLILIIPCVFYLIVWYQLKLLEKDLK